MTPILKLGCISEMLTSALPPSPVIDWDGASAVDDKEEDDKSCAGRVIFGYGGLGEDGQPMGIGGRPPMFHTKSNTNILRRFGNRSEAPRVTAAVSSSITPLLDSNVTWLYDPLHTTVNWKPSPLCEVDNFFEFKC